MLLEALCDNEIGNKYEPIYPELNGQGIWESNLFQLLGKLNPNQAQHSARLFHNSIAHLIIEQVLQIQKTHSFAGVGLCGGVFQNRLLTEKIAHLLKQTQYSLYLSQCLPANDAAISFGQISEIRSSLS